MKRLATIQPETSESLDINLSPLIDMVFLLLIFFMVTSVFVEQTGVKIEKPTAATAEQLDAQHLVLSVTAEGEIVFDHQPLALPAVRGVVRQQLRDRQIPVVIVADTQTPSGLLVDVLDECRLAGAQQVSVATQRERP